MTTLDPEDYQANLAAAVLMFQALGPYLVRLDVSPRQYANLQRRVTPERRPDLAQKLAAVDVHVVEDLVPGAVRLHWSDGRVVTRYRLVQDPRVLQVAVRDQRYYRGGGGPERHGLSVMGRHATWGWTYLEDASGRGLTSAWKGQRSSRQGYVDGRRGLSPDTPSEG